MEVADQVAEELETEQNTLDAAKKALDSHARGFRWEAIALITAWERLPGWPS